MNIWEHFAENKRLFVKGIIWEIIGVILLILMFRVWAISIMYVLIRVFLYPIYHKLWKKSKWGK